MKVFIYVDKFLWKFLKFLKSVDLSNKTLNNASIKYTLNFFF